MNTKRIFIFGFGLLILLGLATGTTYFWLNRYSGYEHNNPSMDLSSAHAWAHEVGLTKEQEKKLEPYENTLNKDVQALQVKLAEERIALCRLIKEEPAESKKVADYTERVSALEAEQQKLVINHLIVMRDILNPDQREKLFSSLMHEICMGCRQMVPGQKCICGMCDMPGPAK